MGTKYRKGTIDDINKNCHVVCKVEVALLVCQQGVRHDLQRQGHSHL